MPTHKVLTSCIGCKFLIREDKPECFLHYLVKIDKEGIPWPVEKCSRRKEFFDKTKLLEGAPKMFKECLFGKRG